MLCISRTQKIPKEFFRVEKIDLSIFALTKSESVDLKSLALYS